MRSGLCSAEAQHRAAIKRQSRVREAAQTSRGAYAAPREQEKKEPSICLMSFSFFPYDAKAPL